MRLLKTGGNASDLSATIVISLREHHHLPTVIFDHQQPTLILILFSTEWGAIPSFIAVSSFGEVSIEYPHHSMETFPLMP